MRLKMVLVLFFFVLALGPPSEASAAFVSGSVPLPFHLWPKGLIEPGATRVSVAQARQKFAETPVIVRGNITQYVGSDQYVFEDATSSILVSISDDKWHEQDVTSKCLVELHGKLQKSPTVIKISVAKIIKVQ